MSTPSFEQIKKRTEEAVSFIEWLADVLRGKNWVKKLLLIDVLLFAIFNPLFFPSILELFTKEQPPPQYPLVFWLVIGLVFVAALIVALRKADLQGADLFGANLQRAKLFRAILQGAELKQTNLEDAEGLTQEQLDRACGNEHTKPPPGLSIKPCA